MADPVYAIVAISPDTGLIDYEEACEEDLYSARVVPPNPKVYFTCIPINESIH